MKNCVFFASWMPIMERSDSYIDQLKNNFSDCDIYVGINPSYYTKEWQQKLENSGLNIKTSIVPDHKVIKSDASAFEEALNLYKSNGLKEYDYTFFIHTKGVSYYENYRYEKSRKDYFDRFCTEFSKESIQFLNNNPTYGGWCPFGKIYTNEDDLSFIKGSLEKTLNKNITHSLLHTIYFVTHYTIRGNIINQFLLDYNPTQFNTERFAYYFEFRFPYIIDFYKYVRHINEYWDSNHISEENKQLLLTNYIKEIQ